MIMSQVFGKTILKKWSTSIIEIVSEDRSDEGWTFTVIILSAFF